MLLFTFFIAVRDFVPLENPLKVFYDWVILIPIILLLVNLLTCSFKRSRNVRSLTQLGSIIFHLSILLILIGAGISSFFSVNTQIRVGAGDSLDLSDKGFSGYKIKVQEFKIDYYYGDQARQYTSAITLMADGEIFTDEVSVNHPLTAGGIKLYQIGFGWLTKGVLTYKNHSEEFNIISGTEVILDPNKNLILKTLFIPDYDDEKKSLNTKTSLPNNPRLACTLPGNETVFLSLGDTARLGDITVSFSNYNYYTTLLLKKDPGLFFLYLGFVLMLAGLGLRYLPPHIKSLKTMRREKS